MTAKSQAQPNQRGLFWLILFLLMLLLFLIIWLTIGFGWNRNPSVGNLTLIEPIAGGVIIPDPTPVVPAALDNIVLDGVVPPELRGLVFLPEQPVVITNQATSGSADQMPIVAEPRLGATVLDVHPAGTILTVLEPTGDYSGYPLEIDGVSWVRVRDSSGLIGWTKAGMLYPLEVVDANQAVPLLLQPDSQESLSTDVAPAEPAQAPAAEVKNTVEPEPEPTPTSTPAG